MKLLTKVLRNQLIKNGLATIADPDRNTMDDNTVKFFNPCGGQSWFFSEAELIPAEDNYNGQEDLRLFGFCDLSMPGCEELGYVMLSELSEIRVAPFGLGIERDTSWRNVTLGEVINSYQQ